MLVSLNDSNVQQDGANTPPIQQMVFNGVAWDRVRGCKVGKVNTVAATGSAGTATIWTPAAGKKFRVLGLIISCDTAMQLTVRDSSGGTAIVRAYMAANSSLPFTLPPNGYLSVAANNSLTVDYPAVTGSFVMNLFGTEE